MLARWRKIRADRRLWAKARTLPELCNLMARWVEGDLSMWPGYSDGAAEETLALVPVLARANRGGFLTDASQPGFDGTGFDGLHWQQRAAVSGFVTDEQVLSRIRVAATAAGLVVFISHPRLLPQGRGGTCTLRGGQPYTVFGEYMPPLLLRHLWAGVHRQAMAEIVDAWQVTVADPDYGPSDRVWTALDAAMDVVPAVPVTDADRGV